MYIYIYIYYYTLQKTPLQKTRCHPRKETFFQQKNAFFVRGLWKNIFVRCAQSNRQSNMSDAGPSLPDLELVLREIRAYEGL